MDAIQTTLPRSLSPSLEAGKFKKEHCFVFFINPYSRDCEPMNSRNFYCRKWRFWWDWCLEICCLNVKVCNQNLGKIDSLCYGQHTVTNLRRLFYFVENISSVHNESVRRCMHTMSAAFCTFLFYYSDVQGKEHTTGLQTIGSAPRP